MSRNTELDKTEMSHIENGENNKEVTDMTEVAPDYSDLPAGTRAVNVGGGKIVVFTKAESDAVRGKLDRYVVGILCLCYFVAFLDRSNIGNANTAGMSKDLGVSDANYQWLLTAYYLGYIFFHWQILMYKIVRPKLYVAGAVLTWGIAAMMMGVCNNFAGLLVCRLLIGAGEAGVIPCVAFYMSFFYGRDEIGFRYGIFISTAAISSTFAGAMAYGIVQIKNSHLESWRLLFLIEGAPTVLVVPLVLWLLPNSPGTCRFLTPRENEIAAARVVTVESIAAAEAGGKKKGLNFWQAFAALKDPMCYIYAFIIFTGNVSFSSISVFLPQILKDMGYTSINAQGLSAPPYLVSFFFTIGVTYLSDRVGQRGPFHICAGIAGGVGYVLFATTRSTAVKYFALFLAISGLYPFIALSFIWITNNQASESKRGMGLVMFGMIGQLGPIVGVRLYPKHDAPLYHRGQFVCAGMLFGGALFATLLTLYLRWANRKRDELYGPPPPKDSEEAFTAMQQGDDSKHFRYIV